MSEIVITELESLLGITAENISTERVSQLEEFIERCNTANTTESPLVADGVYDTLISILTEVKPDSYLLQHLWDEVGEDSLNDVDTPLDEESLNYHLFANPMQSIQTVKSFSDSYYSSFESKVESLKQYGEVGIFCSFKLNGHAVRVVYRDGFLTYATTRGRAGRSRNITDKMKVLLGEFNSNIPLGIVEVRGEVVLPSSKLPLARQFSPALVSEFTAVSSLLAPSAPQERTSLLSFIAYQAFTYDARVSRSATYHLLEQWGFTVPENLLVMVSAEESVRQVLDDALNFFESRYAEPDFDFNCDGVVVEVDDPEDFLALGDTGIRSNANIALKLGQWEQKVYTGYTQQVIFTPGSTKLSPVAVVASEPNLARFDADGVLLNPQDMGIVTATGARVSNVPLYSPAVLLQLGVSLGSPLSFYFGGESAVLPCDSQGRKVSERWAVADILSEN